MVLKKIVLLFLLVSLFFLNLAVLLPTAQAQGDYGLSATAGAAKLTGAGKDLPGIIGNVIGTALSLIAVLFFALMLYGGFMWMTAHGNEQQVTKALDTIFSAIIGIIIVLASYAITNFVLTSVYR